MPTTLTVPPPAPRPPVDYQGLFREPVYADGGPYDRDDEDTDEADDGMPTGV